MRLNFLSFFLTDKFRFERHGYFAADRVDHAAGKPVFNLAVGLKESRG